MAVHRTIGTVGNKQACTVCLIWGEKKNGEATATSRLAKARQGFVDGGHVFFGLWSDSDDDMMADGRPMGFCTLCYPACYKMGWVRWGGLWLDASQTQRASAPFRNSHTRRPRKCNSFIIIKDLRDLVISSIQTAESTSRRAGLAGRLGLLENDQLEDRLCCRPTTLHITRLQLQSLGPIETWLG